MKYSATKGKAAAGGSGLSQKLTQDGSKPRRPRAAGAPAGKEGGVKRRRKPGALAKMQIRQQQRATTFLFKHAPFRRALVACIEGVADSLNLTDGKGVRINFRLRKSAVTMLQNMVESDLVRYTHNANLMVHMYKKKTVQPSAIKLMAAVESKDAKTLTDMKDAVDTQELHRRIHTA